MGRYAFYITDDVDASEVSDYTKCSEDLLDGGFKNLTNCVGRYLIVGRDGSGMTDNQFMVNEIRAYSVINLLEGASVIESPEPSDSTLNVNNLLENQSARSGRQDINAIIDWNGVTGGNRVVTRSD